MQNIEIQDSTCRILKFQDSGCRILKFQDLACRILKFQDSICRTLKFQDLTCRILKFQNLTCRILKQVVGRSHKISPVCLCFIRTFQFFCNSVMDNFVCITLSSSEEEFSLETIVSKEMKMTYVQACASPRPSVSG